MTQDVIAPYGRGGARSHVFAASTTFLRLPRALRPHPLPPTLLLAFDDDNHMNYDDDRPLKSPLGRASSQLNPNDRVATHPGWSFKAPIADLIQEQISTYLNIANAFRDHIIRSRH